jgi:hypothetical protein
MEPSALVDEKLMWGLGAADYAEQFRRYISISAWILPSREWKRALLTGYTGAAQQGLPPMPIWQAGRHQ